MTSPATPAVSIIVLNWNKPNLTARCVVDVQRHADGTRFELIVVDNGSTAPSFGELTARVGSQCTLVRLDVNRYFGEANNIAAERARGHTLVFLNNDAFVTADWLAPLLAELDRDPRNGCVGPKLIYPDGRLQEVGARVGADGFIVQFGKSAPPEPADLTVPRVVDYCSAACVAMRRSVFLELGGFAAAYEPAYYEDVDLCMRLAARGYHTVCAPAATVVHLENATSATPDIFGRIALRDITELNRERFLARWGDVLARRDGSRHIEAIGQPSRRPATHRSLIDTARDHIRHLKRPVAFYVDDLLTPSGGVQYLLAAAGAVARDRRVIVVTRHPTSALRIAAVAIELGLDAKPLEVCPLAEIARLGRIATCVMTSHSPLPPQRGFADRTILIWHGLAPSADATTADRWDCDSVVDRHVAISPQVAAHATQLRARLGLPARVATVIAPRLGHAWLAAPIRRKTLPDLGTPLRIVAVGRFHAGAPSKRHDVLIEAARCLQARGIPFVLDLVGSLAHGSDHRADFTRLRQRAEGLPVRFHADWPTARVQATVADAHVLWHGAGYGVGPNNLDQCEPFGLAVLEGMAVGTVPLVVGIGGPASLVTNGVNGLVFTDFVDLADQTAALTASANAARYQQLSMAARATSAAFDGHAFDAAWQALFSASRRR